MGSGEEDGMGLDEALDAAIAEKERTEWLAARDAGFGCSDLGALWLILGWAGSDVYDWHEVDAVDGKGKPTTKWVSNLYATAPNGEKDYSTPRYLWESTLNVERVLVPAPDAPPVCAECGRRIKVVGGEWLHVRSKEEHRIVPKEQRREVPFGMPRLIGQKAGLVGAQASSDAQEEGKAKERQLFQQSRLGQFQTQAFYAPDEEDAHIVWGDRVVSTRPFVLRDAEEPRLLCTVEAWEHTPKGLIAWELKTDRLGLRTKPPWYQRLQAIGQAVVLGAEAWGIQYGPRWAQTDAPSFPDLPDPVQWGPFQVKDDDRKMIRQAVREGWAMVEAARARQEETR